MPNKVANIAKNTSYFTFALIVQKVIAFAYFTLIARQLPPEYLGKFYLAVGFTSMFGIFMDKGLANVLVREVAKTKNETGRLLGAVLALKLPLMLFTFTLVFTAAHLLGYSGLVLHLIYLAAIAMALDSFSVTFYAVLRGHHNLKYESIGSVVYQLIMLIVGLSLLYAGYGLYALILVQIFSSLVNFSFSLSLLVFKIKIPVRPLYRKAILKPVVKLAIPFALYGIFQRLYTYLDTVMLSKLAGDYFVGIYQIPFKIVFALQFLPMAFIASVYPAFASYWNEMKAQKYAGKGIDDSNFGADASAGKPAFASYWSAYAKSSADKNEMKSSPSRGDKGGCKAASETHPAPQRAGHPSQEGTIYSSLQGGNLLSQAVRPLASGRTADDGGVSQLVVTFERAMNYLVIVSLPITVGVIALADKILLLFRSAYGEALVPLQIIIIALVFLFLNFPIGAALNACDRQKYNTANMGIALAVSVALNLFLIPRFQAVGASISVLLTNLQMFIIGLAIVRPAVRYRAKKLIVPALKALFAAALMGVFVWYVKTYLNIFIVVPLAGALYFGALFLVKGFRREDVMSIYRSFLRKSV